MIKKIKAWDNVILQVICSICIFLVCTINLNKLFGPVIVPDETGYWAAGYFFNGIDWNGVMEMSSYYGWGYGLILSLVCKLPVDTIIIYRVAIIVNAAMLVGCFFLAVRVSEYIFSDIPKKVRIIIGCAITLYSGYVYYSQSTYCETLVLFLFWTILLLLLKILEKKRYVDIILLSMAIVFLFAVHQRTVIILIAAIFTMFIFMLNKKISIRQFIMFSVLCGVLVCIVSLVKNYLTDTLYSTSIVLDKYNTSGQLGKLSVLLSVDGLKKIVVSFMGKILYAGTATFLLFYVGAVAGIRKLWEQLIKKCNINIYELYFLLFVFISFAGEILVSSYSLITSGRMDHIVYGRYTEFILGAIVLYGLCVLYIKGDDLKIYLSAAVIQVVSYITTYCLVANEKLTNAGGYSIPGMYGIWAPHDLDHMVRYSIYVGRVALLIFLVAVIGFYTKKCIASIMLLLILWVAVGLSCSGSTLYAEQQERGASYYEFAKAVEPIIEDENVYYIINDTEYVSWLKFKLKFFLPKTNMIACESGDYEKVGEQDYIILYNQEPYYNYIQESIGEVIYESEYFTLARKK